MASSKGTGQSRSIGRDAFSIAVELGDTKTALNSYLNRCAVLSKAADEARDQSLLHQGTIESLQRTVRELKAQLADAERREHDLQRENSNMAGYIDRVREIDKLHLEIARTKVGGVYVDD